MSSNYQGKELKLFENARNWKAYFKSFFSQYLSGDVLEIGSGVCGTTKILCTGKEKSWTCLEPDPELVQKSCSLISDGKLPRNCTILAGTLDDITTSKMYDAILIIDVIEHVEEDEMLISSALQHLRPKGKLVVLVPAHQWLFSPFDKAIGHLRRYNKNMIKQIIPRYLTQIKLLYLDSAGLCASLANRLLLKQSYPGKKQIYIWDTWIVGLSKLTDPLLIYKVGKSLLGIWEKPKPVHSND